MDWRNTFRSLYHRNFRLFIIGQGVSLTGTWMQNVAMGWLVYKLTGSAMLLGTVGFLSQLPSFLFSPLAGVLADRYDKRKMLIAVQALAMVQAFILAALVLTGNVHIWHIVVLGLLLGFANAFDMPIRQSFFVEMLGGREDLPNAIVLNSSVVNAARVLGPTIAGFVVAQLGEGLCFLINAISFLGVLAALYAIKTDGAVPAQKPEPMLAGLKAGHKYMLETPPLLPLVLLIAVVSMFGMSFQVLTPVLVKDILHAGPQTLGLLMSAMGVGALAAGLASASVHRTNDQRLTRIPVYCFAFGICLAVSAFVPNTGAMLVLMFAIGSAMILFLTSANSVLQFTSKDSMRGRVLSYYTMAFLGVAPFGSLYAGTTAQHLGVRGAFGLGGFFCMAGAYIFARRLAILRRGGFISADGDPKPRAELLRGQRENV